jgi:hypothetical protein
MQFGAIAAGYLLDQLPRLLLKRLHRGQPRCVLIDTIRLQLINFLDYISSARSRKVGLVAANLVVALHFSAALRGNGVTIGRDPVLNDVEIATLQDQAG